MTTALIIGAAAGVIVILAIAAVLLARRGGAARAELQAERDQARVDAAASKAVADELAKDRSADDILGGLVMRLAMIIAGGLLLAGCTEEQVRMACPPGLEFSAQDKRRVKEAYVSMSESERAAAGPLVKFVDRVERACAAIARAR